MNAEGVNYLESDATYDPRGRLAITSDPAGTITHTFYDILSRTTQTWTGTDDLPDADYDGISGIDPRDFRKWVALNPT